MNKFLSFLTVDTQIPDTDWTGKEYGWTKRVGDNKLIITGGWYKDIEYLDAIEYGTRLDNGYNNFVNPFYLWDILTEEGRQFFLDYYKDDIQMRIDNAYSKMVDSKRKYDDLERFWISMGALKDCNFKWNYES